MSDVEEKTIADELVVTKYKTAGDIVNSEYPYRMAVEEWGWSTWTTLKFIPKVGHAASLSLAAKHNLTLVLSPRLMLPLLLPRDAQVHIGPVRGECLDQGAL